MQRILLLLFIFVFTSFAVEDAGMNKIPASRLQFDILNSINNTLLEERSTNQSNRFHLELKWDSTQHACLMAFWMLLACISRLLFTRSSKLMKIFPESSLLIVAGLAIGILLKHAQVDKSHFTMDSHAFFLYLLPPIIFDAGYFMPNRAFFKNWDSILLFAIVGTLFNTVAIGFSLYGLSSLYGFSRSFSGFEIFLFSSLISAVDPVAVIAVFEEIHINDFMFVNVFGEALFNDAISMVLYELFKQFLILEEVKAVDFLVGTASFFVVAIGGLFVGVLAALLTALFTKYSEHVLVLAPCFIFLVPYIGYLVAETLSLSPLIAIAVCGMTVKQYVKGNMSASTANSVKYFTKMLGQSSDAVVFLFLGLSTIAMLDELWDLWFIGFTIIFCTVFRAIAIVAQCAFLNRFRGKNFTPADQIVLSYGGLRGAIAFGLASSIPSSVAAKDMFLTTTIAVIFFTVFLQGSTIRPLLNYLKVELKKGDDPTMTVTVYNKYLDYLISGVEDIAGQKGNASLVHSFERINNNILCPILMREHAKTKNFDATKILRVHAKLTLRDAIGAAMPKDKMLAERTLTSGIPCDERCKCTADTKLVRRKSVN